MKLDLVKYNTNIHGVHPLCQLTDGHYDVSIGAGRYYTKLTTIPSHSINPISDVTTIERNTVVLCNQTLFLPLQGSLTVSRNGTKCKFIPKKITDKTCLNKAGIITIPIMIHKLALMGYGKLLYYYYFLLLLFPIIINKGSNILYKNTMY